MQSYLVCKEFGWTEDEYNAARGDFTDNALRFMSIFAKLQSKD